MREFFGIASEGFAVNDSSERLPLSERLGYGAADFGINLYFMSAMTYLLYFYTDVFGLSAAAAAGVMLAARLVDAVTDPIMGAIAERTRSRWGRLRPYLLFGALPWAAFAVLTFTVPDLSASGKLWWAYVTYIGFGLAFTVLAIPYTALTASLTLNHQERTVLSTFRMACAFAGGIAVSAGMPILVGGFDSEAAGYQGAMMLFALVATATFLVTFRCTEERVQPPPTQRLALADSFKAAFANPPLIIVMTVFTSGMLALTVRQTAAAYYFEYNLGRADLIPVWFGVTMPVMFIGLAVTPMLAARYGKAGGALLGAVITLAACLGLYFTPYDNIPAIFAWGMLISLGGTPIAVLGWAMLPDTVEFAQWRHGVRADGAIFAVSSFFHKLAKTLGGAGVAAGLAWAGYVANAEQSAASLATIHNMMTLAPAAIMLIIILAARLYPLDQAAHAKVVRAIRNGPTAAS